MTLDEIAAIPYRRATAGAPDWLTGCFKRRSVTFFTGETDRSTSVFWLQTRGLSADFRFQPGRPGLRDRSSLYECSREELAALLASEGGFSETEWDGERMTWFAWTAFQLHSKWGEAGRLHRVGDCLIELAPSGAYVEDWRLQASQDGPLIGLSLIEEREIGTGRVTHCGGGLIICGDHAALVLGRPPGTSLSGRLGDLVEDDGSLNEFVIDEIFSCEASYGVRFSAGGPFSTLLSTNPLREGQQLFSIDGFDYDPQTQLVTQQTRMHDVLLERIFTVDTLEASFRTEFATSADRQAHEWLARESDTLRAYAEFPSEYLSNNKSLMRNADHDVYNPSLTSVAQ
jgi:hypothetical protein